jgi:hypothetical protein
MSHQALTNKCLSNRHELIHTVVLLCIFFGCEAGVFHILKCTVTSYSVPSIWSVTETLDSPLPTCCALTSSQEL